MMNNEIHNNDLESAKAPLNSAESTAAPPQAGAQAAGSFESPASATAAGGFEPPVPPAQGRAQQHEENELLKRQTVAAPPPPSAPVKEKKKTDPIKWIAVGLAAVFAATTVFCVSALGKVSVSGSTVSGTVTAVEGNRITISLSGGGMRGNMSGGMGQGTPPDMGQGAPQSNSQAQSETDAQSEASESESARQDSTAQGAPGTGDSQMPQGGMPGDFGQAQGDKQTGAGEITVKLGIGTEITDSSADDADATIEVGDTVTVSFGALNSAKSVTIESGSTAENNGFNGFPGMQGGNAPSAQSDTGESTQSDT